MKLNTVVFCLFISIFAMHAQERYILTSDSVKLYVKIKGFGPHCLYIHGGPGSGSYWLEEFAGDSLEQHFQMIYLDQRGVGRSSSPKDNNYSIDRMVRDFEEVRKNLGISQWLTLGHSFGGILQMAYVKDLPNSISGMMLINCTLSMNDSFGSGWLPKAIELAGNETPVISRDTSVSIYNRMLAIMPVLGEKGEMWKIFFNKEEDSRKLNDTYSKFESWNVDQSETILDNIEYWNDFRKFAPDVKQPVLFYYGKTDWAIGPEHYKGVEFPEMILWGSEVGHMPFLENKQDLFKAINSYIGKYKFQNDTSKIEKKSVYKALAFTGVYYASSMFILANTWYKNKERVPFHFYNDNRGYLQVDKFGHMFGSYVYSYIGYHGLLKMGASRNEALIFGSTLGFVLQLPIEIMDGIHEGYGFSWGDIAANAVGSALVFGQELLFNEQIIKYKFSYSESSYSKNSNNFFGETSINRLLKDYNGHTYWFSVPINKMFCNSRIPNWLNIAAGYSVNGMYGEFENATSFKGVAIPESERYRQYLISLDIDWTRIETKSKILNLVFKGLTFIKLPFPTLEYNSMGKLMGHWIYF
jgi:proline iminopeptidase